MIYVFPHCKKHEKELETVNGISRLYAYPGIPRFENNADITILDSGAYGLSKSGGRITPYYMEKLSHHYETYYRDNVYCVAPDVYLDWYNSVKNFKKWRSLGLFENIIPILQAEKEHEVNLDQLKKQADYYAKYSDVIFYSNPALTGRSAKAKGIEKLFEYMKNELGIKWTHCLGAGWNLDDISVWTGMRHLDSFDSIAYYSGDEIEFGSSDILQRVRNILSVVR